MSKIRWFVFILEVCSILPYSSWSRSRPDPLPQCSFCPHDSLSNVQLLPLGPEDGCDQVLGSDTESPQSSVFRSTTKEPLVLVAILSTFVTGILKEFFSGSVYCNVTSNVRCCLGFYAHVSKMCL